MRLLAWKPRTTPTNRKSGHMTSRKNIWTRTSQPSCREEGVVNRLALICAFTFASIVAASQQTSAEKPAAAVPRAEVLVLGTYHMANHGQDIYNMQADDVLGPKRQAEMAQVIEVLKRFNPTKIAVEAD